MTWKTISGTHKYALIRMMEFIFLINCSNYLYSQLSEIDENMFSGYVDLTGRSFLKVSLNFNGTISLELVHV